MNYVVFGAGAVGCYVGGRLAAHGQQVTLVGRPGTLAPIATHGLRVTDLDGFDAQVPAAQLRLAYSLRDAAPGAHSVVLLCVKSGATHDAARELASACAPGTPVVSLQNGVDNVATIASEAPLVRVLAGMVPYNVVLRGHQVHRATAGELHVQHDALSTQMATVLNAAGLATRLPADIRAVQWGKLLLNLNNPVNALSDLPLRTELLDRDCRHVLAALQTEALEAMVVAGITPAQVGAVPPRVLPRLLRLPNWLFHRMARRMLQIDSAARSSMWDDLEAGRVTEIDAICGAVVRLATRHGRTAPLNARMCELLSGPRQRLTGAQMRQRLGI